MQTKASAPIISNLQELIFLKVFLLYLIVFYTYILYSKKLDKYYKGHTNNVEKRLERHNSGSETFTSQGVPWIFILAIEKPTRRDAAILERKLKNLNKERLLMFIEKYKI